jgi:hypothetical protein
MSCKLEVDGKEKLWLEETEGISTKIEAFPQFGQFRASLKTET